MLCDHWAKNIMISNNMVPKIVLGKNLQYITINKSYVQATCLVQVSGISLENVLCQNKAAPFFPKTEIPA